MTPADLASAARVLLDRRDWQRPLARALRRPGADWPGIDDRLMRRWAAGEPGRTIPGWVAGEIARLARERIAELDRLAVEMETIATEEVTP